MARFTYISVRHFARVLFSRNFADAKFREIKPLHLQYMYNHEFSEFLVQGSIKASKGAKIRNRYNQVSHLTQDNNWKVTNSQLDTTNESQEVSPFPGGDHKAHINRRAQRHCKQKTEQKHKRSTKEVPPWNGQWSVKYFTGGLKPV